MQKWFWCDEEGEPIGFIQYYFSDATTIGLDMWIGILKERSNGYGTEALKQMVQVIHEKHPQVKGVFIDPDFDNIAAIKCYLKAGFQDTGETIWDDGDDCMLLKMRFED